jgi:hypothetical protein
MFLSLGKQIKAVETKQRGENPTSRHFAIEFDPEAKGIRNAERDLQFGQVFRVTFRFSEPFRESEERLKAIGFVISREPVLPTWWTSHPVVSPLLTGWSAWPAAEP